MKIDQKEIDAVNYVLTSQKLSSLHGKITEKFEKDLCRYLHYFHAIAVNSGTAALHTALMAIGVKPGHEVILPALTFTSTAAAVLMCGATPVFADLDPGLFTIGGDQIREKVTEKTYCVIVVHIAGIPARMSEIVSVCNDYGLLLVEDACQALGSKWNGGYVGSIGHVGVTSFYPSKVITTGEGGCVLTDSSHIADYCREFRNHGRSIVGDEINMLGYNYRMTEIQASIGRVQLSKVDEYKKLINKQMRILTRKAYELDYIPPFIPRRSDPFMQYFIFTSRVELPIEKRNLYKPLYEYSLYKKYKKGDFPHTDYAYKHSIKIPIL